MLRVRQHGLFRLVVVVSLIFLARLCPTALAADSAPSYTLQGLVNGATQTPSALAPNTIATLYGTNLAFSTHTVTVGDLRGGLLPNTLGGVTVYVGGFAASLFYVSPTQINFLVPYELTAGTVNVAVARQGLAGPTLRVQLNATSPGLFQWKGNYAIASHLSGSLVGPDAPAKAGEIVVIYAVGLGRTNPDTNSGRVVSAAASIVALPQLLVTIAGNPVAAKDILYAGLAPGFAGLYQINLRMPQLLPPDPEIRISVAAQASAPRIQLAALPTVLAVD